MSSVHPAITPTREVSAPIFIGGVYRLDRGLSRRENVDPFKDAAAVLELIKAGK